MISKLEKTILQRLKSGKRTRKKFCEDIHTELVEGYGLFFPYSIVPALEYLLENVNPESPRHQGVFSSGRFSRIANRYIWHWKGQERGRYSITLFRKEYHIHSEPFSESLPDKLNVDVEIESGKGVMNIAQLGIEKVIKPRGDLFTYNQLIPEYLYSGAGVELFPLDAYRRLNICGETKKISKDGNASVVIVVYDKGVIYMYNLEGEMAFTSLSSAEIERKRTINKIFTYQKGASQLGQVSYIEKVMQYMKSCWFKSPSDFSDEGKTVILKGKWHKTIGENGYLSFDRLTKSNRVRSIYVSKKHKSQEVLVESNGPYIFFHNNGTVVNAYKTDHIGFECTRLCSDPVELDFIRLRNIVSTQTQVDICAPDMRYGFKVKGLLDFHHTDDSIHAILYQRTQSNLDKFWLFVKTLAGEFYSKEIAPDFVRIR